MLQCAHFQSLRRSSVWLLAIGLFAMAMQTLAAAERRAADALTSCDMATITKRTETTVSRVMSRLRRRGILQRQDRSSSLLMVGPGPALAS